MRRIRGQLKILLVAFTGALFIAGLLPVTVFAADNRQGQSITIGPNEVVNDDLYVAANTIDIQGTINGNLIAVGTTITVSGLVTRDVNLGGSTISIPGEVQGSARIAGAQVTITGKIAGDLVTSASTVTLAKEASVGRDVLAAGATTTFAGSIARNVQVAGSNVVFSGPVGGNVTAYATTLNLDSGAAIQGNLDYTSNQSVTTAADATVGGSTHHFYPSNGPTFQSFVIGWLQTLVGFFLLGALVIFLAPRFNARAVEAYRLAPWSRLGIGLATLIVVPVVAIAAFVFGLIVGGWWLSLFLMGAYMLTLAVGFTIVGEDIGRFVLDRLGQPKAHAIVALLTGLAILLVLTSIPWIGWLFGLIAVVYGTGAVLMALPWRGPAAPTAAAPAPSMPMVRPAPSAG